MSCPVQYPVHILGILYTLLWLAGGGVKCINGALSNNVYISLYWKQGVSSVEPEAQLGPGDSGDSGDSGGDNVRKWGVERRGRPGLGWLITCYHVRLYQWASTVTPLNIWWLWRPGTAHWSSESGVARRWPPPPPPPDLGVVQSAWRPTRDITVTTTHSSQEISLTSTPTIPTIAVTRWRENPDCQPSHFAPELRQSQVFPRRVPVAPPPPAARPVGLGPSTTRRCSGTSTGDSQTAILWPTSSGGPDWETWWQKIRNTPQLWTSTALWCDDVTQAVRVMF